MGGFFLLEMVGGTAVAIGNSAGWMVVPPRKNVH